MKHPDEYGLALYAGGDLPFWKRWQTALHMRSCEACRREAERFGRGVQRVAEEAAALPKGVDWEALAGEMRANIQVGLQAAECVARPEAHTRRLGWRAAAALACVTVVVVGGWWLHLPRSGAGSSPVEGTVAAATAGGVELLEADRALTLLHESSEPVLVTASVDGAMSVHYVDDETGMVTINNVYVQ